MGKFFGCSIPNQPAGSVSSAVFSPDGKKIVTTSGDNSAKICENLGIDFVDLKKRWIIFIHQGLRHDHAGADESTAKVPGIKKMNFNKM
jgi:WD40 repeat protein